MLAILLSLSGTLTFTDAALGCAVAAILALVVAVGMRREREAHRAWVAQAVLTEGTVVRIRESDDVDTLTDYAAVIVYRADGCEYSIDSKPSHDRQFTVGERITVAYDPKLPSSARVARTEVTTKYDRVMGAVLYAVAATIATIVFAIVRS